MKQERKKRSIRRYIKIDKLQYRKYHVADLNTIIKILYPYRQTINKYQKLLDQTSFNSYQKNIIIQTAHSLTIVNELYRDQDKYKRLYVTREDVFNAIYMLQNELHLPKQEYLLSPTLRWFYNQLQQYFYDTAFTNTDVRKKLGTSRSNIYHKLSELADRQFIEIIDKKGVSLVYKINPKKESL